MLVASCPKEGLQNINSTVKVPGLFLSLIPSSPSWPIQVLQQDVMEGRVLANLTHPSPFSPLPSPPCQVLQQDVMEYVNSIARIVHMAVASHGGAANKNIGDAFLLVGGWMGGLWGWG